MAQNENTAFRLLRLCARTKHTGKQVEEIDLLLQSGIDWKLFLKIAQYHQVAALVNRTLSRFRESGVPGEVGSFFEGLSRSRYLRGNFLTDELLRLVELITNEGIRVIPFKGPIMAVTVYGGLDRRTFGDLDLFVGSDRYNQVQSVLLDNGYRLGTRLRKMTTLQQAIDLYFSGQKTYVKGTVFTLDLHRDIMPPLYTYRMTFDELWERGEDVVVKGKYVRTFAPVDLLQILCYHGLKNRWESLKYVCDVAELLAAHPDLDWDAVFSQVAKTHGRRILMLGLWLSSNLLEAPLPPGIMEKIEGNRQIAHTGRSLVRHLENKIDTNVTSYQERVLLHLGLQDTWMDKIRYGCLSALRRVSTPSLDGKGNS